MKKQYFTSLVVTCMVIFSVKAQNTPIDDFLKRNPSMEGVTSVSMSQQMLKTIFASNMRVVGAGAIPRLQSSTSTSASTEAKGARVASTTYTVYPQYNVPEAYSSVLVSSKDIPAIWYANFKKTLLSSEYEQYMEMNKENSIILGYYLKKVNDKCNEIVVLRRQKDQFSAIYIRGDIDIDQLDRYLNRIKSALDRISDNQINMFQSGQQFAFAMPSFNNLKFPNFQEFDYKFDPETFNFKMDENLQRSMEESMKKAKEMLESEDFTHKILDETMKAFEHLLEQVRQLEDK